MSGIHWQLAGPDARLRDYEPCVLLVYDDARSRILKVAGDADGRQLRVTSPMARLPFAEKEFPENDFRLSYSATMGELAERSLGSRVRVMFLPPLQPSGSLAFVVGICLGVLLVLATIFLLGGDRPLGISGVGCCSFPWPHCSRYMWLFPSSWILSSRDTASLARRNLVSLLGMFMNMRWLSSVGSCGEGLCLLGLLFPRDFRWNGSGVSMAGFVVI